MSLDRIILAVSGLAGGVVGLLDLLGFLDVPALAGKVPQLSLIIGGLILTLLSTGTAASAKKQERALRDVREANHRESQLMRELIEASNTRTASELEHISSALRGNQLRELPKLLEDANPALLRVFRPYLEASFRTPAEVILDQTFQLHDLESYRSYHRRAHEVNPGATFFATSLPYRKWFWTGDYVERTIRNFVSSGGRIVRVFFLHSAEEIYENGEVQEVMGTQARLGVEIWFVVASVIPAGFRRFFLVVENCSFAWEAIRGPDDRIQSINVTANQDQTRNFYHIFQQLLHMSTRYWPGEITSHQIGGGGSRPVNTSQDPKAFREFEYGGWEGAVEKYHESWGGLTAQAVDPLLDAVSAGDGKTVLDVASGPGYVASKAAERGCKVTGVDFSPHMVAKASALFPNVQFQEADAESLPFEAETFDAVTMNFGILHLGNPEKAMREAFRVLKTDGRFGFTVWAPPEEAVGFSVILKSVAEFGEQVSIPHGPDFFYYSKPEECRMALTTVGFSNPNVMLLDLVWKLENVDDLFPAFLQGTARTGGLLRRQSLAARKRIEERVRESANRFAEEDGRLVIPMPALLTWSVKH